MNNRTNNMNSTMVHGVNGSSNSDRNFSRADFESNNIDNVEKSNKLMNFFRGNFGKIVAIGAVVAGGFYTVSEYLKSSDNKAEADNIFFKTGLKNEMIIDNVSSNGDKTNILNQEPRSPGIGSNLEEKESGNKEEAKSEGEYVFTNNNIETNSNLNNADILDKFDDGNFIFSANPGNNELRLSLHQHVIDSLVNKSDEELVSISFIPESKVGASLTGVILPSGANIKYSLKKIFQSDDSKDWTGSVTVIAGTNGYEFVLGCNLNFHQGNLFKTPVNQSVLVKSDTETEISSSKSLAGVNTATLPE